MSRDNDTQEKTMNRRSMLKAVGSTAVAGIALSGSASATTTASPEAVKRIREAYDHRVTNQQAVSQHADDLVKGLAESGFVSSAGAVEFFEGADSVETKTVEIDAVPSARVGVTKEFDTHSVEVVVFPERGLSHAMLQRDGETKKLSAEGEDLSTAACDCYYEYDCYGLCPSGTAGYPHQRYSRECCDCDNGTTCDDWSADSGVCCA